MLAARVARMRKVAAVMALIGASAIAAARAEESGRDLLGRARNMPLENLLKPYAASTTPDRAPDAFAIERKLTPAEVAARELKRRSRPIPYQSLARAPANHVGALVTMRGKVVEAVESHGHVTLRVNVTRGQYDHWSDTVYVEHRRQSDSAPRILAKDIVAIWGTFEGIKSYTTVLGATVQIPHVSAVILEPSTAPPAIITGPGASRGVYTMPPPSD